MQGGQGQLIEILLVDDNLDDVEFIQLAFYEARVTNRIHHAADGEAAIAFLQDPSTPRPDLILCDLHMPKMDGSEVLQVIKHDESLQTIPIIMLTSTGVEQELQIYKNYTNCYSLMKPVSFGNFIQVLVQIETLWLQIVS